MVSGAVGSGAPLSVIWGPPDSSSVSSRSPVCLMRGLGAPSRWQNFLELRHGEVRLFPGPMGVDFSGSRVVASRNTLLHDGATNATWLGRGVSTSGRCQQAALGCLEPISVGRLLLRTSENSSSTHLGEQTSFELSLTSGALA